METATLVKKVIDNLSEKEAKETLKAIVDEYEAVASQLAKAILEDYEIGESNEKNNNNR